MSEQRTEGGGETPPTETGRGETLVEQLKDWAEHFMSIAKGFDADKNERLACYNYGEADGVLLAVRLIGEHESRFQTVPGGLVHELSFLMEDDETSGQKLLNVARWHEVRWQADRAAWEAKEKRLNALLAELRQQAGDALSHSEVSAVSYCYSSAADRLQQVINGRE